MFKNCFSLILLITLLSAMPAISQIRNRDCQFTSYLYDQIYMHWLESPKPKIKYHYYGDIKHASLDYEYRKYEIRREQAIKDIDNSFLETEQRLEDECR